MLRVAIVGCGLMTRKKHLPAFLKLKPKIEVVALCDANKTIAEELAKIYKIKRVYADFSQMIGEIQPDIIDIATPPLTHAKLSIEAMEKNCHVLLEKPLALNTADCDAIIDAAQKFNRKVCVIHNQLFNPAFAKARQIIKSGELGDFLGMRILLSTPSDYMTARETHWAHKLPCGVLSETGPHAIYISAAFLNQIKQVSVQAKKQMKEFHWSRFEDFRIDLLADNSASSVVLLYSSNQWAAEVELFTSAGILKIDLESQLLIKYNRTKLNPFCIGKSVLSLCCQTVKGIIFNSLKYISGNKADSHGIIISKFIESILNDAPSPVNLQEAREVVRVMEMLVKNLEEKV